jgi:hypothetical protein
VKKEIFLPAWPAWLKLPGYYFLSDIAIEYLSANLAKISPEYQATNYWLYFNHILGIYNVENPQNCF